YSLFYAYSNCRDRLSFSTRRSSDLLVEGGFQQVDRVPQLAREVVGHRPAAEGGHPGRQRGAGEAGLGPLEEAPARDQVTGLQRALPEPEQRGGLLLGQPVGLRVEIG